MSEIENPQAFPFGDQTTAEALRLAKQDLERLGRRYTAQDIGGRARVILDAMLAARKGAAS
ncbi:MAG: hypothetical protein CL804_03600 [Citromicrobium sp.]|nr:hypothetical protein [Citromicrobium sp.]|tara:strand:- start:644 stop:826 length:183 start_codon:yes stop_codon:yes gene_type:complete